jgi:hypothetical protein
MRNFILNNPTKSIRSISYLLLMGLTLVFLGACKKTETAAVADVSYLRVINASPTLGTFNVYLNDQIVNKAAVPFGGTISYLSLNASNHQIKFTTASDAQSLLTKTLTINKNTAYSFFLIDKDTSLDGLLITDDMANPTTDKAYVKFINLSPDAPALDLNIVGGTSLVTSKAYKTSSTFVAVDPKTYAFEIKTSTTGLVKTTLNDVVLTGGRYYTIISRGLLTPGNNEQAFSAQTIINQ